MRRIVLELYQRKPGAPLLRKMVDRAAQVHFKALIHPFALPIRLWVVRGAMNQLGVSDSEQLSPEGANKDTASIRDYCLWHAVKTNDGVQEQPSH